MAMTESAKKYRATLRGRIFKALQMIEQAAKKKGHCPCTCNIEKITQAWTGCCHLCGIEEEDLTGKRPSFHLDHCHETGVFRGWLCPKCNVGLGLLGDNITSITMALEYLYNAEYVEKHNMSHEDVEEPVDYIEPWMVLDAKEEYEYFLTTESCVV